MTLAYSPNFRSFSVLLAFCLGRYAFTRAMPISTENLPAHREIRTSFFFSLQECLGEIVDTIALFMSRPCPRDFCLVRTFSFFLSILKWNKAQEERLGIGCRERKYRKPWTIIFSQLLRTQVHVVVSVRFFVNCCAAHGEQIFLRPC